MNEPLKLHGLKLTEHIARQKRYYGRTAKQWAQVYGVLAVFWFLLVAVYTRYLGLFDDIQSQDPAFQNFVLYFSGSAILVIMPAIIGFIWWASGKLVRYSRWQLRNPVFWRWFWAVILTFFGYVELDPMDAIHPLMSTKGLGPAIDVIAMFESGYTLREGLPLIDNFQWGYFLLWFLFWFLIAALHWQYFIDGFKEVWFFTNRVGRYSTSVLTGFNETMSEAMRPAVTSDYPDVKPERREGYRGVPYLNVDKLTEEQARLIIEADQSNSISAVKGQPTVLFIDLSSYSYSPELAELTDTDGNQLVRFSKETAKPVLMRSELVVPLKRSDLKEEYGD